MGKNSEENSDVILYGSDEEEKNFHTMMDMKLIRLKTLRV